MASIHKDIPLDASPDDVWDAVRDFGALHTRLVPGFVRDTRLEGPRVRIVSFANGNVVRELLAQVDLFRSAGLSPDYLDCHMGSTLPAAYAEVSAQTGVPFLYSDEISGRLASYSELSPRDASGKKEWLAGYLRGLGPGVHLLVAHPGVPGTELESLTGPDSVPYRWAAEYRLSDLAVLTDPDISGLIDELGIRLCSLPEALAG